MNLTQMSLQGFRSFKEKHEIHFEGGAVFVLGSNQDDIAFDSNGAGKTSLCSAIPWALYGILSTDAKKDAIIHRESDGVKVELRFGDELHVIRSKDKGKPEALSFWHEGRWHEGDLSSTQDKLDRVLGVSSTLFFNSLWIDGQSKSVQFLWATPGKRLELLEELMADGVYAAARSKAEEQRKGLEQKRSWAKGKIESLIAQEEQERQRLNRAQSELSSAHMARTQRLQKQTARQVELRLEIGRLQAEVEGMESEDTPDALLAHRQMLESEMVTRRQQIRAIPSVPSLPGAGATCPTCQQVVSPEHVANAHRKAEGYEKQRQQVEDRIDELTALLSKVSQKQAVLKSNASARAATDSLLRSKQRELADLAGSSNEDPFIASLQATIEQAKDAISGIQGNIRQHEQIMHDANRRIPLFKFWEVGFGARGIRSLLLDDVRALLAYHVDLYANALAGDQIRVEFPQSDKGFEIILHTPGGSADLNTFSRGEAWRANLGVLLALRKTVQHLNATRLSLLILDDPCGDLDDSGVRAVVTTVRGLASEFGTVLVTLPRLVDNIPSDDIIQVEKRQGCSTLVVTEEV